MNGDAENRPRTATRLRYVAPPGLRVSAQTGDTTIGRYEILETLGKGAMGIVYKARDPLLDRIVAVKTIVAPQGSGKRNRKSYLERFEREAKAAAKMQHPAIVTIFDVGTEEGQPFMVLEYLPGDSLADRLDKVRVPLNKGVQVAIELAGALGFAHNERIVHRDVKPANVLCAGDNTWKLADFGIARMPDSDLTQVGIFMGTPGYAPPEAIREGQYTPQADVFAWGAVLYELLSGRIPYEGPDTRTTNGYVLKNNAKSPRAHDASIPEAIAEVCMMALHPATELRYKDGHAAKAALEAAWEQCLNEEILSPRAFSGKDVPHSKAGKHMHGTVTTQVAAKVVDQASLVVSQGGVRDDDPTTVMILREPEIAVDPLENSSIKDMIAESKAKTEGGDPLLSSAIANMEAPQADFEPQPPKKTESVHIPDVPTPSNSIGLWISATFAGIMALGLAAYYLMG